MKLFIGIVAGVILLIMGGVSAQPGEGDTSVPEPQEHQTDHNVELVTIIDDVEIPLDVLIRIQKEHIGYAATQADEVSIEGQVGYRLVATRYDEPSDQDEDRGIRLLYDSNWELINESEIIPEPEDGDDNGDDESDDTEENGSDEEEAENDEDEAEEESSAQEADEPNGNIDGPREETSENDEAADTEDEEETDGDTTDGETTEEEVGTADEEDGSDADEEEINSEDESGDSSSDQDDADDTNEGTDDGSNTA